MLQTQIHKKDQLLVATQVYPTYLTQLSVAHPVVKDFKDEIDDISYLKLSQKDKDELMLRFNVKDDLEILALIKNKESVNAIQQRLLEDTVSLQLKASNTNVKSQLNEIKSQMQYNITSIIIIKNLVYQYHSKQLESLFRLYEKEQSNQITTQETIDPSAIIQSSLSSLIKILSNEQLIDTTSIKYDKFAQNELQYYIKLQFIHQYINKTIKSYQKDQYELYKTINDMYKNFYLQDLNINLQMINIRQINENIQGKTHVSNFNLPLNVQQIEGRQKVELVNDCFENFDDGWD